MCLRAFGSTWTVAPSHQCTCLDCCAWPAALIGDVAAVLTLLQVVIQQDFDIRDPAEIAKYCADANLVINLVGTHQETWNFGFSEVHVDFAKAIAEAAAASPSVERLLHVSCLGASPKAPSQRLQTKVGSLTP